MALTGKARKGAFREEDGMPGRLLAWYDAHHRDLPWRVPPSALAAGVRPDPYHVWLSEIMLQQTTVEAVKPYFRKFLEKWPEVTDLAAAEPEDVMKAWAGLGYYSRARNLKKCADLVASLPGSLFPDDEDGLRGLPGIGAYTAAAIAAIAFGRRAVVVDGNVERVMSRLFEIRTPLPDSKAEIRALLEGLVPEERPGDFAQAMMDLGATICTPKRPRCMLCPVRDDCRAILSGDPEHSACPSREGREAVEARRGLCGRQKRWRDPLADAARQGPARRHERSADIRLDRPDRRRHQHQERAVSGRLAACRQHLACLHAFFPGARCLPGRGQRRRHA